jgi:hypothetical protein
LHRNTKFSTPDDYLVGQSRITSCTPKKASRITQLARRGEVRAAREL